MRLSTPYKCKSTNKEGCFWTEKESANGSRTPHQASHGRPSQWIGKFHSRIWVHILRLPVELRLHPATRGLTC
jgi:hypothetical protein